MPRGGRPSFMTRKKEQDRRAKANEKREAKRARRKARAEGEVTEPNIEIGPAESEQPVE